MSTHTEKNRQVADNMSKTYKTQFEKSLKILYRVVQEKRLWASDTWIDTEAGQGKEIKMLDYACGPGTVSTALAPFATKVIGVDLADGMIDEYNSSAREAGFADKMVGHKGDLLADSIPEMFLGPEYSDFDVVFVSMAFHHFEKPDLAMKRLAERLKKGGACLIIDFLPHGRLDHNASDLLTHFQEATDTIMTHGFTREDMRKLYEAAGVGVRFDFQVIEEPLEFEKNGMKFSKTIFIARGQRE
ncbi:S-adenosyl-L-methionine-dependent methyltransferase [Aspergillus coremiiformis]|uniref:S-adenosyl-L-methionine-dependent methyltransferase n=1 Tax=Aspergillus coremiiformis TaxID=138285 RepID=A0A5N6ZEN5_9EURO|nr:S-adenosyl-L-methionine-dependent methyltransferase [Aspergillus coremiiformis]